MPNSIYTKTKNQLLDARSDKQDERDQHLKVGKQAEIAGVRDIAQKHKKQAGAIDAEISANAPSVNQSLDILDEAEGLAKGIAANKPSKKAGKLGFTKSGNGPSL